MALELYYTSSPRGLRPGTSGLCTVATTRSMSPALVSRLETLCGYRPPSDGTPQDRWPVAQSHWVIDIGGVERHVLASVRPVAPDHTMRSNTLAHFAVLHTSELDAAGPAWMLAQPETSAASWKGEPRTLDAERAMPRGGAATARKCAAWQRIAGDAGWAGVLANAAMLDPSRPATVICPAGAPALELAAEAMSLLPAPQRWGVTFTTYFTQPIAGLRCTWRFCLEGTSAATAARQAGGLVIDLCAPQPCTRTGAFIDAARTGRAPELSLPAESAPSAPRRTRGQDAAPAAVESDGPASSTRAARSMAALRAPVGVEEPEPSPARGRTMLAAVVVAAVVLLAAVAVMAVLMRTMGQRTAEIETELKELRAQVEASAGDAERAAALDAQVAALEQQLMQARKAVTEAEGRATAAESEVTGLQTRLEAKSAPPRAPADPAGSEPKQDAADQASPEADVPGRAAAAPPRQLRMGGSAPDAPGSGVRWLSSVRPPAMAALKDTPLEMRWPEAQSIGINAVTLSASAALQDAGFEVSDAQTLVMRNGDSAVPVGSVAIEAGAPTWTWRSDQRNLARTRLAALGVRLPEDVDVLMGQLEIEARLADGSVRRAVPASRRMQRWELDPSAESTLKLPVASLLGSAFTIELDGQSVEVSEGTEATLAHRGMGSIHAKVSDAAAGRSRELTISWRPEGECARLAECAGSLAQLQERMSAADARWTAASAWADAVARSAPSPASTAMEDEYGRWKQQAIAAAGPAEKSKLQSATKAELAARFAGALWAERKAAEDALSEEAGRCAALVKSVDSAMKGLSAIVRTEAHGPEAIAISIEPRLDLPVRGGAGQARKGADR